MKHLTSDRVHRSLDRNGVLEDKSYRFHFESYINSTHISCYERKVSTVGRGFSIARSESKINIRKIIKKLVALWNMPSGCGTPLSIARIGERVKDEEEHCVS